MKTGTIRIPITVVLPREYSIEVKLDGNVSTLSVLETYPEDIPQGTLERTIELFRKLTPKGELIKVEKHQMSLKLTGTELEIARYLASEFEMLADASLPPLPQLNSAVYRTLPGLAI